MLRSRWLSTFTVIGAILIVLGIVGLILGPRFVYDPGQPVTGKEAWCYLAIGVLMVLNGILTPAAEEKPASSQLGKEKPGGKKPEEKNLGDKTAAPSVVRHGVISSNGTGKPSGQDVPVSAEKND